MQFQAQLESTGKTTTGIVVPDKVLAQLGPGRRPAVLVTINGHSYPTTVGTMGGRSLISVSSAVRQAAAIAAGDTVTVEIELDDQPREVAVPVELAELLDAQSRSFFDGLSFSRRQRFVQPIEAAKTEQTRRRHIERAVTALQERRPQP